MVAIVAVIRPFRCSQKKIALDRALTIGQFIVIVIALGICMWSIPSGVFAAAFVWWESVFAIWYGIYR